MRLTLLTKLLLYILTPALLGLVTVAGFSFHTAEKALVSKTAEDMTLIVEQQQRLLANMGAELGDSIENSAHSAHFRDLLQEYASGGSSSRLEALKSSASTEQSSFVSDYELIREAGLISADGTVLAHSSPDQNGTSRAERNYFKAGMQNQKTVENLISSTTKEQTTIIAVPVSIDGKSLGVLFADIDIPALSSRSTDIVKLGSTGICYVYSEKGTILMHPNKSYIGDDDSKEEWVRQILSKGNGRQEYEWDGRQKVAYFRSIPEMGWILVLAQEREEVLRPITSMLYSNIILVTVSILIVGLIIFTFARNISSTLKGGANFVTTIAEGNLTVSPEMQAELDKASRRGDEIGTLSRGIGHMVDNIRQLFAEAEQKTHEAEAATEEAHKALEDAQAARREAENARREGMLTAATQVEEAVSIISSASTELSAQIEQAGRGAEEQAARTEETASAMEEMNSTVLEVARNAGDAAKMSSQAREKAEEGERVVQNALESIKEVQRLALKLMADMKVLDGHAQSISQVMSVISDIADQTNLLALNAAIEAARAGEAGRGFAVVADEVRKLAEKTMASTSQVGDAITAIQESANQSMRQVETAVHSIDTATELAGHSGEALEEIVKITESTEDQVRAIAAASEQQSASSEEINRSVTQVTTIAGETARAMEEATHAVSDLARQAQILNSLVEDMRRA